MIKLKSMLSEVEKLSVGYHVTFEHILPKIKAEGLVPQKPKDADDLSGVYLFKTLEDCKTALENWMGDRICDMEEEAGRELSEVVLKVDLAGLKCLDTAGYEYTCIETIHPNRILKIFKL